MMMVVSGKAIIRPIKPSSAPQTESESNRTAGLRPIADPMILGVVNISVITCTIINPNRARPNSTQKFCPVSAAFSMARKAVGMMAKVWR